MPRSRLVLLLSVVLVALVGAPSAAGATPSAATRAYAAAAPSSVTLPSTGHVDVSVVLTNCGPCADGTTSSLPFASARVQVPAGVVLAGAPTVAEKGWRSVVAADAASVLFVSTGKGTTTAVQPGGRLTLSFPVSSASVPGTKVFGTEVKQSNDFSGAGNEFLRTGADPVVVLRQAPVPARIEFVQGPSTVQQSPLEQTSSSTTPVLVMCPAPQVRVVDADGATITSLPPTTVTVKAVGADPGLRLAGSTTLAATTSGGIATFGSAPGPDGTCASGLTATRLGTGYVLSAYADFGGARLSDQAAKTFDVRSVYALCGATCTSPLLSSAKGGTKAQVVATGGDAVPDELTFSVDDDAWDLAEQCNPDSRGTEPGAVNPHRATVTVDLADHDKSVQLSWSKQAVQWATNNGASQWQVCLAAVYPFPTIEGEAKQVEDSEWYVGTLLPCSDPAATGPCLSSLGRSGGRQTAVVSIPNVEGDPRMI